MSSARIVFVQGNHDQPRPLRTLIGEAQEAERQGRNAEARALYERALYALHEPAEGAEASAIARWIARCYAADGDVEAGIDSARLALAIAEAHGNEEAAAHALNMLGILHQTLGDLDQTLAFYHDAERRAQGTANLRLTAMLQLNLGTVALIRGEFDEALARYEQCLVGFHASASEDYISYVLNNVGMLHTDLGRWEEAERAFEGALESCERSGNSNIRVMVLTNLAELYVATERTERAEHLCATAWELMSGAADERAEGELCKVHGIVLREHGHLELAGERLRRAAELAEERKDLILAAEVTREQAVLFALQDRNRETLQALNRSHRLFTQLRARRDIADLDRKIESLEQTFLSIVRRWGESIESADRYTQGHCVRVADYACALARAAGMDDRTLLWFHMGALLHDVGKIVIPPEVLNKPGGFTPEERVLLERHPDAGVELLRDIEFPWDIRPVLRFHHERWGGGGYPTGIAGEEIPLPARILAIADVFDALTTDRPYRPAFSLAQALEIMGSSMRGHFDPRLLKLWLELCDQGGIALPGSGTEPADPAAPGSPAPPTVLLLAEGRTLAELRATADAWRGGVDFVFAPPAADAEQELAAVVVGVHGKQSSCVASILRAREAFPDLPVLAMLDREDEELALRLIQHGAQDCLVRNTTDAYLIARTVRRAVARGRLHSELHVQSLRDDLTGLYNRRGFFATGVRRLRAMRQSAEEPVILFLDLDGLKGINDEFGHAEGDRALMELAGVLRATFGETDVIGRLGGDEFAILTVPDSGTRLRRLVGRIEQAVAARNEQPGRRYALSVSVGSARVTHDDERGIADALDRADRKMYVRKRARDPRLPRSA